MGCCKKKKAAGSLAPSDKYHKNTQGAHRHVSTSNTGGGGGETSRSGTNNAASVNNNHQFSHNGIPPSARATANVILHRHPQHQHEHFEDNDDQQYQYHLQQHHDQLIRNNHHPQSSPYQFYPATTSSLGSSSIASSSHQPPFLLYKSNHSHSSSGGSGNGSQHIVIDGSNNGSGSVVDGSSNKYYYYYNGHYYPATAAVEELSVDGVAFDCTDPDQVFTITATQSIGKGSNKVIMGRVGEDVFHPPGSPASVGGGGGASTTGMTTGGGVGGAGLFKSKSGSITGSPQTRGFRDTFISSMNPGNASGIPLHAHSAESSPLHRSASATTANHHHSDRYLLSSANVGGSAGAQTNNNNNNPKQENNKKWSFGGLFRRNKSKSASTSAVGASLLSTSPASTTANNNSYGVENIGASSTNNSNRNSPAKFSNNNYGSGSPISVRPVRTVASPARPASSVGFISLDPNEGRRGDIHRRSTTASVNSTPKFVNAESQTRAKGKLSESDISTCDSDFELAHENLHDNPPEPAPQENKGYKQNFLVRRLSRRKEKAAAKKAAAAAAVATAPQQSAPDQNSHHPVHSSNGFIASSQQLDVPQMKRRVGSSPDSLNNSSEPWPSCWETTKKPQTPLQALQHPQQRLLQNYSSNGSLSVSQDGYNSNNNNGTTNNHANGKSSRAALREAVKARAIARRESFLQDSSSSDDDTEERSRSSLHGSFSSLNSRNRRQRAFNMQQAQFQQQRHLFPATTTAAGGGISCASPSSPMPVPLDYRNVSGSNNVSSMSPNMNRRLLTTGPPGSPKWEARLIYHQQQQQQQHETENGNQPVMVRLPRKGLSGSNTPATIVTSTSTAGSSNPNQMSQNNGDQSFIMATEMISEDQHVVTAGLKVPFLPVQNQHHPDQQCMRNGQLMYPDDPVQYANVANGMRGRSTPYTVTSSYNNGSGGAIHHASPTPPPPPPPRRDFTSRAAATSNNPNFYRPVSCSYLDSYANQLEQQQMMRHQSPMMFNGNYIYPPNPTAYQHQGQDSAMMINGFASHSTTPPAQIAANGGGLARSSPRHFIHAPTAGNNNEPDVDSSRHPPLIRSPSEPPATRVEHARISSPVKRLISSPMPIGNQSESGSLMDGKSSPSKNVVTSKLGFPVRRLQEASKLASSQGGSQTPVHLRASEFWRKKESEVTGSPSPVGGGGVGANNQKKYFSRIRSADSSPLPVPKMRKSPGGIVASNESISSLSSFSENAASPGPPKNCSSPIIINSGAKHQAVGNTPTFMASTRAHTSKASNSQLAFGSNNKDKENNNMHQSAVERLKVRIPSAPDGIKSTSSSANPPPSGPASCTNSGESRESSSNHTNSSGKSESNNNPIRALIELNNGKTPGKNLEDALNELEDMYQEMKIRLSDEDLLDRAERRDLPTAHQELRDAPLIPIPQAYRFEHLGSVESLGTGSGSSGTNYTAHSAGESGSHQPRVRAPPVRRSIRPDTVSDDMANRRLAFPDGKPLDPRIVVAKTGSYLARSPAFSPCTSPCPPDGNPFQHQLMLQQQQQHQQALALLGQEEPDVTLDDVSFRNYKRANSIRIIEPQPKFGIPLGPITAAPATDYLHSKPSECYRPFFGHLRTPDIVNDDIAFRNLRKDLGPEAALGSNKDWTPRLFSPNRDASFNYPKDNKKLRAIRSLSANITHMIPPRSSSSGAARDSPTSCFHQQQQQQQYNNISREIGKWNSYSDLAVSPARASTYLQPSWVEQIEKVQTSTETLTDHRNSRRFSTAILDPPEHWERKFPQKTVELTTAIYDPTKPRRPWTDIILESYEKQKEKEMERLAAEAAAAAAAANETAEANNKREGKSELEEDEDDDDVFMDASDEASKSAVTGGEQSIKISETGGKNNGSGSEFQLKPNMENALPSSAFLARPLPLLPGQKTRRGSWVEPSRSYSSSAAFQASQNAPTSGSSTATASHAQVGVFQERRRKSWSDLPKDIDSFSSQPIPAPITLSSGSSYSASPTRKLFNPLPPPKKIRQINLEAFNNNNSNNNSSSSSCTSSGNQAEGVERHISPHSSPSNNSNDGPQGDTDNVREEEVNSVLTSSSDKVKSTPADTAFDSTAAALEQVEKDELNELMDQLLKDADACSQSIRDEKAALREEKEKCTIKSTTSSAASNTVAAAFSGYTASSAEKSESVSSGGAVALANVNTQRKEMKMDGSTSSSEKSSKQDLSCAIVGIIPKHQSTLHQETNESSRSGRVQQQEQAALSEKQGKESKSSLSPAPTVTDEIGSSRGSKKGLKPDTLGNGKGNVVSCSQALAKEQNDPALFSQTIRDSKELGQGKDLVDGASTTAESSIEDLIESINESLPELEASYGGAVAGMNVSENTQSSDGKPNDSSSVSGSPASPVTSPSPGSPTPHVLSLNVRENESQIADVGCVPASSAFPVAAKRHHLPSKAAAAEESLYENLPAMMAIKSDGGRRTGNDAEMSSSYPSTFNEGESKSVGNNPFYNRIDPISDQIPPLLMTSRSSRLVGQRETAEQRAPHHDEVGEDFNEDGTQHSNSSSHQPSSLSSNDSSEVSGSGGCSPGEENVKQNPNSASNTIIKDNIKEGQANQTCSSSTLPSSISSDAKNTSNPATTNLTGSSPSFETFTTKESDIKHASTRTSSSSTTSSSTREPIVRKKSEGSFQGHLNDRDHNSSNKNFGHESFSPKTTVDGSASKFSHKQQPERVFEKCSANLKRNVEDYSEKRKHNIRMSHSSCSSAEETHQSARKEQPVDSAAANQTFTPRKMNQETEKKLSTSTTTTPSAAAAEASASEASNGAAAGNGGMSFLRGGFPFFRNSSSRSRSQSSVISDVSRSSETGDSKKEKDKSYRRKSHLNRAFTDEPVPDNNFQYDLTPKSSKPTSQEASSLESSAVEESRGNPKPSVKLHPAIPPVLASCNNKSDVALNKSGRTRSSQNLELTPSPVPTTKSQAIGKLQAEEQQNRKSSPVAKKDSFSDAEGVSFIKKMLQKESDRDRAAAAAAGTGSKQNSQNGNCTNASGSNSAGGAYNLKKSPSAGNQSYWSKFSSSQSAFLRKLFEKPKVSDSLTNINSSKITQKGNSPANDDNQVEDTSGEKDSSEKENAEPVLGFSVAQKASFFMKLEHDQRFSKWRKNSVDLGSISSTAAALEQLRGNESMNTNNAADHNNPSEFRPRSSRHLTQPITPTELKDLAPLVNSITSGGESHENGSSTTETGSQDPRISTWTNNHFNSVGNSLIDSSEKINNEDPSKSFYKDYDDIRKFEPIQVESLKEGVNKFDEFVPRKLEPMPFYPVTPPTPAMKSYSLTRSSRNNGSSSNHAQANLGGFPMYHSASAIINTPSSNNGGASANKSSSNFYKNSAAAYNYSSSSSSFSEAMSRQENLKFLPLTSKATNMSSNYAPVYESHNGTRRGSASDVELQPQPRSDKVKSMFISRTGYHCDTETLSEDGEFSSGGLEVAEICRSYENSPVFRKKNWRSQKHSQANFTKEIWRRCGNHETWNQRSQTNPSQQKQPHHQQHPVPQTFTATTNVIEVTAVPPSSAALPLVAQSTPTKSSLFQILTVLSSSNDELNETKPKAEKRSQLKSGNGKYKNRAARIDFRQQGYTQHASTVQSDVDVTT